MADTIRTIAEIQTLLADNTTGAISPQDLRDMLVSLANAYQQLNTKGWKDNVAPIFAVPGGVSAPALANFGPAGTLQRQQYAFALNDYVLLDPFHINHDISNGCMGYFHVHWSTNGTSLNTTKWELHIQRALGHNQAAFGAPVMVSVTQAASGVAWQHMIAEVSLADALTLTEPDELLLVTLRRVTNGGTDNADSVFGLCVDLHYESDRHATLNKAPNFNA
jgi:hypothetical protein